MLAVINSQAENDAAFASLGGVRRAYIGLHDTSKEGHFEGVDGRNHNFVNWAQGEPNSFGGNEDCVGFHIYSEQQWNDFACSGYDEDDPIGYVCQNVKSENSRNEIETEHAPTTWRHCPNVPIPDRIRYDSMDYNPITGDFSMNGVEVGFFSLVRKIVIYVFKRESYLARLHVTKIKIDITPGTSRFPLKSQPVEYADLVHMVRVKIIGNRVRKGGKSKNGGRSHPFWECVQTTLWTGVCNVCLKSGMDYCYSSNSCVPSGAKVCDGPCDHVSSNSTFARVAGEEDCHPNPLDCISTTCKPQLSCSED